MRKNQLSRQIFFFVVGLVIFTLNVCKQTQPDSSLNIMSFNIRYDNPADGVNAWKNRKDLVAKTISFYEADICGLQEVLDHQLQNLAEMLPEYDWIGVGRDDGIKKGEYAPVFFRSDRLKLLESGFFWLSETPEIAGSFGWDAACTRIVTWGKFSNRTTREEFYFFNTHFDHVGNVAREKSAKLLLEKIESLTSFEPVFVTGDFNCTNTDKPYSILTSEQGEGSWLHDTQTLSQNGHYGGTQTFNGFNPDLRPNHIIDFIFVRETGPVLNHGIIADRWDGRFVSDHYPVCAKVILSKKD
jgi:endonuclease/exonuclease/phosphatase family metal-dependent hydrolase